MSKLKQKKFKPYAQVNKELSVSIKKVCEKLEKEEDGKRALALSAITSKEHLQRGRKLRK